MTMWWETVPAQIVLWATAIGSLLWLLKTLFGGAEFMRRLFLAMFLLGDTKKWPNGSSDLLSSLNAIYSKTEELGVLVHTVSQQFEDHLLEHR